MLAPSGARHLLHHLQSTDATESLRRFHRGRAGIFGKRGIEAPQMDNSTACRLIGIRRALEQPPDVLGLVRANADVRAVRALVRFTVRDESALFTLCFQDLPQ